MQAGAYFDRIAGKRLLNGYFWRGGGADRSFWSRLFRWRAVSISYWPR
jgi:hypothetical protein